MNEKINLYDVCIVGASIAGNYLSFLLSHSNLKIAIIEEHEKIGYPFQCAGIVSKKLANLISFPQDIILNRVKVAKLVSPRGKVLKLSGDERPFIIDRVGLDKFFYEKTKSSPNIHYYLREIYKSFYQEKNAQELIIETSKRRIKTRILVGCDGPMSSVGQQLGVRNNIIYATQIRVKGSFNENEATLYFDEYWNDLFGWIVPEGNNIYRIGLACSKNLSQKFQIFLTRIGVNYEQKIDQQGGIIPLGIMNDIAFDSILLLGDSACQVKATTGGGIIMLLNAAKYAARCILKSFNNKNFSKKFIKKHYQTPCEALLGTELKIHYLIRLIFQNCSNQDIEELFKIIENSDIKEKISLYGDMDFPKKLILKLLCNINLIKFIIKLIFKNPILMIKTFRILF